MEDRPTDPMLATPVLERTVFAVLGRHALATPDKVAFRNDSGGSVNYREAQHLAH